MEEVDLLITDIDWLATCDCAMTIFQDGALAVKGDRLVAVGETQLISNAYVGRKHISLKGCIVIPGLVNTHTHAAMSLFKGISDDLPLERWLHDVVFPAESRCVDQDFVYLGTLLAISEMLLSGTTTFCDGYFFEEWAARAALEAGCRAVLGQGIIDFPSPDLTDPKEAGARIDAFLDAFPAECPRLQPSIFCHAPYSCSANTLKWVKEFCRQNNLLFQIHVSETKQEVIEFVKEHGKRPVMYLDKLGILDEKTLCVHAVWVDDEEIRCLASRGVKISHNLESNMKLGAGISPVVEMLGAGLTVGLGTDSCASNNDLDLLSEMDRVAKVHKVWCGDPSVLTAEEVLLMATLKGAQALGMKEEIGSLEAGKKADFVAIDINQPHLVPLYNPVSHLVYAARGSDVRHVWVDGNQIVKDAKLLTLDTGLIIREAQKILRKKGRR